MRTTAILFRILCCLLLSGISPAGQVLAAHPAPKTGLVTPAPADNTRRLSEGEPVPAPTLSGLSSALLTSIAETRLRRAELTRYLASEAKAYGAFVSEAAQADRDTAAGLFAYLDSRQNYVDQLTMQDLAVLPVGLKVGSEDANTKIQVGILKATFLPDRALLSVFVRVELPAPDPNSTIKVRELFFGADNVVFSRDGGLSGDFNLVLLGDFVQPLGNMTLRIKGGLNRFQSADINKNIATYASISCERLASMGIVAEVLFPRSMLVPINPQTGEVTTGQVSGAFKVIAPTFNDLTATVTLVPFAVTGYEKFGFIINNVILDLSDKTNADGINFPSGYFAKAGNETPDGKPESWKGVYIGQLSVLLPPEFKPKGTNGRLSFGATNLLYDRNGITGNLQMQKTGARRMSASGWAMSLEAFELGFEKNKLTGGRFAGQLQLPVSGNPFSGSATSSTAVSGTTTANSSNTGFTNGVGYMGIIDDQANYKLTLSPVRNLVFPCWRATAQLAPTSRVELAVVNGAFKPKAILHGRLGIFCNVKGEGADSVNARIKFKGIVFENFTLQTEVPYLSASYFGYENETRLVGFPVSVNKIGVVFPSPTTAGLRLDLQVNLMEGKFGGSADFTILGELNTAGDEHYWTFKEVKFSQICVKGTASTFSLDGCIAIFDNDPTYGDGFGGRINFSIDKLAKYKVKGEVAALFGVKDFRYWFVSGGVDITPGIPLVSPLELTGMYLGAYHNMAPSAGGTNPVFLSSTTSSPMAQVTYVPNNKLALGFKAIANLQAIRESVFKGTAGLEMTFNESWGLNTIAFYGEGQMMADVNLNTSSLEKISKLTSHYKEVIAKDGNPFGQSSTPILGKALLKEKAQKATSVINDTDANIRATLSLMYDHPNRTFHGDATVRLQIGNFIRGSGWMQMHFDPQEWYVHVNNPTDRANAMINFGIQAKTAAYFMVGHRIPAIPAPPVQITSQLRNWKPQTGRADTTVAALKDGKGIAFGASTEMRYELDLWLPYLRLDAVAGFDLMMRTNSGCTVNRDVMYARGQVYAWLQGEAGVRFLGRRPILTVGAATVFDGGLAKPSWLAGEVALYLRMGRIINTTVNFDLSLGQVCR